MPCVPGIIARRQTQPAPDAFAFSPADDTAMRALQNLAALWTVPWVAYWAVAFETLHPENYRR